MIISPFENRHPQLLFILNFTKFGLQSTGGLYYAVLNKKENSKRSPP
jgi:hypothetical protein